MSAIDFTALRELIISRPKQPIQARVDECDGGSVTRSSFVLFDGVNGWYIDDGSTRELNLAGSALTVKNGRVTAYSGHVHMNAWVKPLFAGHLMTSFEPPPSRETSRVSGEVLRVESVLAFPCYVAELQGMRSEEPEVRFRMWVECANGFVLRMQRLDSALSLEVTELTIGERMRG